MVWSALAVGLLTVLLVSPLAGQEGSGIRRIIDFGSDDASEWFAVNDGVMGGRSSSSLTNRKDGVAVFEGQLSLENNGGFASIRSRIPTGALVGATRIVLRVRGDGMRYELRLRPDRRSDGIAYGAAFETTAGQWTILEVPLDSFEPTFRGHRPPGVGPLDASQIGQLGIMLSDKQEGPFRLEIEWIGVDRAALPR